MEKVIQAGPATVTVGSANGVGYLKVGMDQQLGGGEAAGIIKAKAAVEIDLGAEQGADLALALIEAHFPSIAPFLESTVKPAIHAELQKL